MAIAKVKVTFTNEQLRDAENQILECANRRVAETVERMDDIMFREIQRLTDEVLQSDEFQQLKTPALIGRIGFTPEEVERLDNIEAVIAPRRSSPITNVEKDLTPGSPSITMQWVDMDRLKEHPIADHPLTRLDPQSGQFVDTGTVVSWIEWWEEGVTIRGHVFSRGNQTNQDFSRSGEGIMMERQGGLFLLRPARVFQRVGDQEARVTQRNLLKSFRRLMKKGDR